MATPPLIRTAAPFPPGLDRLLGYFGSRRFVSVRWDGERTNISDGFMAEAGLWPAWVQYTKHPAVRPHLKGLDLLGGGPEGRLGDRPPGHALLLDRQEGAVYAGTCAEVAAFLDAEALADRAFSDRFDIEDESRILESTEEELSAYGEKRLREELARRDRELPGWRVYVTEQRRLVIEMHEWLNGVGAGESADRGPRGVRH